MEVFTVQPKSCANVNPQKLSLQEAGKRLLIRANPGRGQKTGLVDIGTAESGITA